MRKMHIYAESGSGEPSAQLLHDGPELMPVTCWIDAHPSGC
jgi:hypothetical protein